MWAGAFGFLISISMPLRFRRETFDQSQRRRDAKDVAAPASAMTVCLRMPSVVMGAKGTEPKQVHLSYQVKASLQPVQQRHSSCSSHHGTVCRQARRTGSASERTKAEIQIASPVPAGGHMSPAPYRKLLPSEYRTVEAQWPLKIRARGPQLVRYCDLLPSAAVAGRRDTTHCSSGPQFVRPLSRVVICSVTACSGPSSADKEASVPAPSRAISLSYASRTEPTDGR